MKAQQSSRSSGLSAARLDGAAERIARQRRLNAVRIWLWVVAIMVIAMVVVGGATRMTGSGLSITEWKPIHGAIPPLSLAEWQEEFEKYKQIPQYALLNPDMDLDGFKFIFWWEWSHRLLGRLIGLVFAVPFVYFLVRGYMPRRLRWPMAGLFALGGLQGFVGWWMVASGLVERTEVSQYRLAVHLTLACLLLAAIVWVAEGLRPLRRGQPAPAGVRRLASVIVAAVLVQIFLGGLVAGLRAGWTYNTWPLIDGAFIPEGLTAQAPLWRNFFENPLTVQFDHRMVAYGVVVLALLYAVLARASVAVTGSLVLLAAVLVQAVLGVLALIHVVPLSLGLAHQFGAIVVLTIAVAHRRHMAASSFAA